MFISSVSSSGSRFVSRTTCSDAVRNNQDSTIRLSRKPSACPNEEIDMNVDSTDEPRFAAYVAIDWGDSKHVWSMQPADSDRRERGEIEHSPEAVAAWAAILSTRFGGQPVAGGVEP